MTRAVFTKGSFPILTNGEGTKSAEGYVHGPFGIRKTGSSWAVTHIPSGFMISVMARPTLAETKAVCVKAAAAYDWSADTIEKICAANNVEPRALRTELYQMNRA